MQRPDPRPVTATELLLIRHAAAETGGRLAGRRDVALAPLDPARLPTARAMLGPVARLVASPARRCLQTAAHLFPDRTPNTDAALWEQDFGAWDGLDPARIPDLGPLPRAALAAHAPPGGESFTDLFARTAPALRRLACGPGPVAIVAHAGTVRAALSLALGSTEAGLAFAVAPLSVTRVTAFPDGTWAIGCVNITL